MPTASTHWGRYTWEPEDGTEYLTDEQREAAATATTCRTRSGSGWPTGIARFTLEFTLANDGDPLDDPTAEWEGEHEVVELGELEVIQVVEDAETPDKPLVFDPMRLTDGIEPSDDPILAARPKAYCGLDRAPQRLVAGATPRQSSKVITNAGWSGTIRRISSSDASASIPRKPFTSQAHLSM